MKIELQVFYFETCLKKVKAQVIYPTQSYKGILMVFNTSNALIEEQLSTG